MFLIVALVSRILFRVPNNKKDVRNFGYHRLATMNSWCEINSVFMNQIIAEW